MEEVKVHSEDVEVSIVDVDKEEEREDLIAIEVMII